MRKGLLAVLALVVALVAAAPAHAGRGLIVGVGDQKASMFDDPRLNWLGIRHARLVVPWYVGTGVNADELGYVDRWLSAARRHRVTPLISFGHGFVGWTRIYLPKPADYRRAVAAFHRRYPWVRQYIAWNEANHCSQPTCKKPERAAAYYDAMKSVCRSCTIIGAAVIDQPNMVRWLRRFRRAAKHEPRVYGLHNYLDVNRLRTTGTRRLLRAIPRRARVWITETGGVVYRKHYRRKADFPESAAHAGKVTRFVLRTARRLRRIDRVYLYHWNADRFRAQWDSGLVDHRGRARPGFLALARHLGRNPRRAPKGIAPTPPPPTPIAQNQPPAQESAPPRQEPPPPQQQPSQPPPEQQPPPPTCTVPILCPAVSTLG
jgi:Glycosyl hydrolase catalytic core